jgi:hypothetical protein
MQSNRDDFFIKEETLAEVFGLELKEFDKIVSKLENTESENLDNPIQLSLFTINDNEETSLNNINSSIQLKELLHFRYRNRVLKIRLFSKEGALAIASYLDNCGSATELVLGKVLALIEQRRIDQIDANIRQAIYENSSSLIVTRQRHWLGFEDVFRIFKTTRNKLEQAFENIQRSDNPMQIQEDFEDIDNIYYFSFSGLEKLSIELTASLYSQERRDYCQRVPLVAPPIVEYLALAPSPNKKDIDRAMRYAENRDRGKCQVTGIDWNKYDNIEIVRHHLFDQNAYRPLASDPDNIITISKNISDEFHQWNGGNDKTCTIDDFISFIELFYTQKHEIILRLLNLRIVLQVKLSRLQRALPESD